MTQLSLGALGGIHLAPDVLDEQRGAWCSPPEYTAAVGEFDLDPFTNPRSTLVARHTCMLERGDDGFGLGDHSPGVFYVNGTGHVCATSQWRVWIQPPYDIVHRAIDHYGHTRFVALLRLDTSTDWYERLWSMCEVIMVPHGDRIEFVPPPGVKASSNPFPHGFFYRRAADVTDAIKALCYAWPCPSYPWAQDPIGLLKEVG